MHKDIKDHFIHVDKTFFLFSFLSFLITATYTHYLTYGDVSGSTKDEVDQHRVEGCVQAKHRAQGSQESICHAWFTKKKKENEDSLFLIPNKCDVSSSGHILVV